MAISKVFEPLYLNYANRNCCVRSKNRRHATRCGSGSGRNSTADDHFRCGRDERGMLERVTDSGRNPRNLPHAVVNLDKKLFPEEQTLPPVQAMDLKPSAICPEGEDLQHQAGMFSSTVHSPWAAKKGRTRRFQNGSPRGRFLDRPL